jgi:hypothetical protein
MYVGPGVPVRQGLLPGYQQIYTLTWVPGARTPGTPPEKSTHIRKYVGPGGPYARDPGQSTKTKIGGAQEPVTREVNTKTPLCGARGPVCQGPREVNKYTQLCGARKPRTPGTPGFPGGPQIYTVVLGPGPPYARDPGRLTNVQIYVEPGNPNCQRPREVNKYTQVCGALEPRMPGTPGSKQINTLMWGPRTRMPGTPGGQQIYTIM